MGMGGEPVGMMGTMDAARLGCPLDACAVFAAHARGRSVPEIARATGMAGDDVRRCIVGVWAAGRSAAKAARIEARLEGVIG